MGGKKKTRNFQDRYYDKLQQISLHFWFPAQAQVTIPLAATFSLRFPPMHLDGEA